MVTARGKAPHVGHFVFWSGGCLMIGRAGGVVPFHAHYAIQVAFGSVHGIRFRGSEREEWTGYGGAIIPSRQPHAMDATGVRPSAVIFVEPETREGRRISEGYLGSGIAPVPQAVLAGAGAALFAAWEEAWQHRRGSAAVSGAARRVVAALAGGGEPDVVADERVLRAAAYIRAHLDTPLTLEAVAAEACLSPGRFRHLFVEETGMGLRPYVLWRRFLRAWELLMGGGTLSAAAHGAGFADAAHLTRTSRAMFGFPPSVLQFAEPLPADPDAG